MFKNLFLTKPVEPAGHVDAGEPVEGSLEGEATLKRSLTATQLVMLGIGAVIGAGIFVLSGHAAAEHAGPAIVISFIIAGWYTAIDTFKILARFQFDIDVLMCAALYAAEGGG